MKKFGLLCLVLVLLTTGCMPSQSVPNGVTAWPLRSYSALIGQHGTSILQGKITSANVYVNGATPFDIGSRAVFMFQDSAYGGEYVYFAVESLADRSIVSDMYTMNFEASHATLQFLKDNGYRRINIAETRVPSSVSGTFSFMAVTGVMPSGMFDPFNFLR